MSNIRKRYSRDFKVETVRLLETSGKSASQIEHDLGIGKGNLSRWKQEFAADGDDAFPGHGRRTPEQEHLRQLEREDEILRQERDILEISNRHLLAPKAMRFQLIEEQREKFPVIRMCQVLNVSPSGYYAWRQRTASAREMANQGLANSTEAVHKDS